MECLIVSFPPYYVLIWNMLTGQSWPNTCCATNLHKLECVREENGRLLIHYHLEHSYNQLIEVSSWITVIYVLFLVNCCSTTTWFLHWMYQTKDDHDSWYRVGTPTSPNLFLSMGIFGQHLWYRSSSQFYRVSFCTGFSLLNV